MFKSLILLMNDMVKMLECTIIGSVTVLVKRKQHITMRGMVLPIYTIILPEEETQMWTESITFLNLLGLQMVELRDVIPSTI